MKFELDITEHEAEEGLGMPPVTGTYLFVVTEFTEFVANSGSQGANVTCRIVGTEKPDTKKYHGSFARLTFFMTEKTIGRFRGWLDKLGVPYGKDGMDEADTIGKVFWGRIRCYVEDGYDKQDILRWEKASDEAKSHAAKYIAEWTGEDKPPETVGKGVAIGNKNKPTTSPGEPARTVDEHIDDDIPF